MESPRRQPGAFLFNSLFPYLHGLRSERSSATNARSSETLSMMTNMLSNEAPPFLSLAVTSLGLLLDSPVLMPVDSTA
jgi:hypothetical protein